MKNTSVEYVVENLDHVIEFFADGYNPKGKKVMDYEFFIDVEKKKVVFKLYLEDRK